MGARGANVATLCVLTAVALHGCKVHPSGLLVSERARECFTEAELIAILARISAAGWAFQCKQMMLILITIALICAVCVFCCRKNSETWTPTPTREV